MISEDYEKKLINEAARLSVELYPSESSPLIFEVFKAGAAYEAKHGETRALLEVAMEYVHHGLLVTVLDKIKADYKAFKKRTEE